MNKNLQVALMVFAIWNIKDSKALKDCNEALNAFMLELGPTWWDNNLYIVQGYLQVFGATNAQIKGVSDFVAYYSKLF